MQVGTAFTYQGRLTDGGSPASGSYDLRFSLYDAATEGTAVAPPQTLYEQPVVNGLFTVRLDFGAGIFNGERRYLEIGVCVHETPPGQFVVLSPRQELTAVPYASYALNGTGFTLPYWGQLPSGMPEGTNAFEVLSDAPEGRSVYGQASGSDSSGVQGVSTGSDSFGVAGYASGSYGVGVYGGTSGSAMTAIHGRAAGTPPEGQHNTGGKFLAYGTDSVGVYGEAAGAGVEGLCSSSGGYAIKGTNQAVSGQAIGVYGVTYSPDGYAGYFEGKGRFTGQLEVNGTATLSASLQVLGALSVGGYTTLNGPFRLSTGASYGYVLTSDGSGYGTWQPPAGGSLWEQSGSEIYYSAGNVGVGVTDPETTLHVAGGNGDLNATEGDFKIGNATYRLKMGVLTSGGGTGLTRIQAAGSNAKLLLGNNGVDTMTITNTGVGIGTVSPSASAKLDVAGQVEMDGFKLTAAPVAGHVLTSDASGMGTWQAPTGGGGLTLPYSGSVSSPSSAFSVTNSGTGVGSSAITARLDNPASNADAAAGYFSASGSNGHAVMAISDASSSCVHVQYSGAGTGLYASSSGSGAGRFNCGTVDGYGIKGTATATTGSDTVGGWFESSSAVGKGAYAAASGSGGVGLYATSSGSEGYALYANATGGAGCALFASNNGVVPTIEAKNSGSGDILRAKAGNTTVFRVGADGTTQVNVLTITGGADLAENFQVRGDAKPGMVVSIDPDHPGGLCVSRGAYNRCVAGVISGAKGVEAGMILANLPGTDSSVPVALSGRVWVCCDATHAAIEPGDMLTTADKPGHAMAVADFNRAHGCVIGKAMSRLAKGETGMVLVLVNLQ